MKNLVAKILTTAALAATLTACKTNPSNPDATDNPGSSTPRAVGTMPAVSGGNATNTNANSKFVIKWGNKKDGDEGCNKPNLSENKIRTDKVCIRLVQGFKEVAPKPATTRTAPAANGSAKIDLTKPLTIYTATVTLPECSVANRAGNALDGFGSVVGNIGDTVTGALKQGANRVVGGGIAGRAAGEAVTAVTGAARQAGQRVANDRQEAGNPACAIQINDFIATLKTPIIPSLSKDFAQKNAGAIPAYTITSELPKSYENQLKAAVGEPIITSVRTPH